MAIRNLNYYIMSTTHAMHSIVLLITPLWTLVAWSLASTKLYSIQGGMYIMLESHDAYRAFCLALYKIYMRLRRQRLCLTPDLKCFV
jgi:hypothetical protein